MSSKTFCLSLLIVLAGFALNSAAGATEQADSTSECCSKASLSGPFGFALLQSGSVPGLMRSRIKTDFVR